MIEGTGDIWEHLGSDIIAITTNGHVTKNGTAVLGRGVARQAQERFPDLPLRLGALLREFGNHVVPLGDGLVSFPIEESPWSLPDLRLIRRSAQELCTLADRERWERIVVPRPGCGGGGLSWHEVRPLLAGVLDGRFLLMESNASPRRSPL